MFAVEFPKSVIGALATALIGLAVASFTSAYKSHNTIESFEIEVIDPWQRQNDRVQELGEFYDPNLAASRRSADRTAIVKSLAKYNKDTRLRVGEVNRWHLDAANARIELKSDLGDLARFSIGAIPETKTLRKTLDSKLRAELALWDAIEKYVKAKSADSFEAQVEDSAFRSFQRAGEEHLRAIGAYANAHLAVTRSLERRKAELDGEYKRISLELTRARRTWRWSSAALALSVILTLATLAMSTSAPLKARK